MSKKAIEMKLVCNDDLNPIIIRDRKLIQKTPYLNQAAFAQNKKWTFNPITFPNPIEIPFPRSIVEFVLHYSQIYRDPCLLEDQSLPAKLREYKEVHEKGLQEQKALLDCSRFLECSVLAECIAVVMAKKMQDLPFDQMEALFGVKFFTDRELEKDAKDHQRIQDAKRRRKEMEEELQGIQDPKSQEELQQKIQQVAKEEKPRYISKRLVEDLPRAEKILDMLKDSDDEEDPFYVPVLPESLYQTAREHFGRGLKGPEEPEEHDPEEWLPKPVVKAKPKAAPMPKQAAPRGTEKQVKMKVVCKDGIIIVTDRKQILRTPFLKKAASAENPKWAKKHITFNKPVILPYTKSSVEFLLEYLPKYPDVRQFQGETDEEKLARYPEANKKGIKELKEILDISTDHRLSAFAQTVGYVLAEKLNPMDRKDIKEFLGDEYIKISLDKRIREEVELETAIQVIREKLELQGTLEEAPESPEEIQLIQEHLAVKEDSEKEAEPSGSVDEAPEEILPPGYRKIGDLYPQPIQEPVEPPKKDSISYQELCNMARRSVIQSYGGPVPEVFPGVSYRSAGYKAMVGTRLGRGEEEVEEFGSKGAESEWEESEESEEEESEPLSSEEEKAKVLMLLSGTFCQIACSRSKRILKNLEDQEQGDLENLETSSRSSEDFQDPEDQEQDQEDFLRIFPPASNLDDDETSSRSSQTDLNDSLSSQSSPDLEDHHLEDHTFSPSSGYLADSETSSLSSWSSEDQDLDFPGYPDGYQADMETSSRSPRSLEDQKLEDYLDDDLKASSRSPGSLEDHNQELEDFPGTVNPDDDIEDLEAGSRSSTSLVDHDQELEDLEVSSRSRRSLEDHDQELEDLPGSSRSPQTSKNPKNHFPIITTESLISHAETLFANLDEDCTRAQRRQVVDLIMRYTMIS